MEYIEFLLGGPRLVAREGADPEISADISADLKLRRALALDLQMPVSRSRKCPDEQVRQLNQVVLVRLDLLDKEDRIAELEGVYQAPSQRVDPVALVDSAVNEQAV